ncbi:MAG: YbaB/EbfC family nucleoid-associated protein [Bacillota bacterium]|jgi:DNA-binding YbaB/EbfC family protein
MGANMQKMMKQMQKMQRDMEKMQAEAAEKTVEASAGGGAVTVTVSGNQEVKAIQINPDAVDLDDIEMLEDMVMAAVNEGLEKSKEMVAGELSKLTGGMNIPGLF